jgi:hypothetical protein
MKEDSYNKKDVDYDIGEKQDVTSYSLKRQFQNASVSF